MAVVVTFLAGAAAPQASEGATRVTLPAHSKVRRATNTSADAPDAVAAVAALADSRRNAARRAGVDSRSKSVVAADVIAVELCPGSSTTRDGPTAPLAAPAAPSHPSPTPLARGNPRATAPARAGPRPTAPRRPQDRTMLAMLPRPTFFRLAMTGGFAYGAYYCVDIAVKALNHDNIVWHGSDNGAPPPTVQVFMKEEVDQAPALKRIWRTSTPGGFGRHNTKVSEEGQQPTV